jgi:hypothetical protein
MPVLTIAAETTSAISISLDSSSQPTTDVWAGGSSPIGQAVWTGPFNPGVALETRVAFRFPTPSEVDLPTNAIITAMHLRYSGSITSVSTPPSLVELTFGNFVYSPTQFHADASAGIFVDSVTGTLAFTDSILNIVNFLPTTRAQFVAETCQDVYTVAAGSPEYQLPQGPFYFDFGAAVGGDGGSITTTGLFLDITYTAPNPCWYNPLTNQWTSAATTPGPNWHEVDCPAPITDFTINPVFGSVNGGD